MLLLARVTHRRAGLLVLAGLALAAAFALGAAGSTGTARSTAAPSGLAALSLTAHPFITGARFPSPAAGQPVVLRASVSGAVSCAFRGQRSPFSSLYLIATIPCRYGHAVILAPPVANRHYGQVVLRYSVTARSRNGKLVTANVSVSERGEYRPVTPIDTTPMVTTPTPTTTTSVTPPAPTTTTTPVETPPESSAPVNKTAPSISGSAQVGQTLQSDGGSWSGTPTPTVQVAFFSCPDATQTVETFLGAGGSSCGMLTDGTSTSYTLQPADAGAFVYLLALGQNGQYTFALSAPVGPVIVADPVAPAEISSPQLSGDLWLGETVQATQGSFSGSGPFTYSYQWQETSSADLYAAEWTNVGDGSSAYTVTSADAGLGLQVIVTATGPGGSLATVSDPVRFADSFDSLLPQPAGGDGPQISGYDPNQNYLVPGQQLHVATGLWQGTPPLSFSYQWERCDSSTGDCTPIDGATSPDYTVSEQDGGFSLTGMVTATNAIDSNGNGNVTPPVYGAAQTGVPSQDMSYISFAGVGTALADGSDVLQATVHLRDLAGFPIADSSLQLATAADSDMPGSATTISPDGTVTTDADGLASFTVSSTSGGQWLGQISVPGTDFSYTDWDAGNFLAAPVNLTPPSISHYGRLENGTYLTGDAGSWSGNGDLSYQWLRCDADAANCVPIDGATDMQYVLADADGSSTLIFQVSATNTIGTVSANSAPTGLVAASPTTVIESGPDFTTAETDATFGFRTDTTLGGATCTLDDQPGEACTSPQSYSGLAVGDHAFLLTGADGSRSFYFWTITSADS